jgi:hypothetical protein
MQRRTLLVALAGLAVVVAVGSYAVAASRAHHSGELRPHTNGDELDRGC